MPVSKKRKKSGKTVQRAAPSHPSDSPEEQGEAKQASHPQQRMGKPSNPFVAQHQTPRGAQRGR